MNSNSWEIIDAVGDSHIKNHHQQQRYGQNVKNYETEWRDLCMMISSDSNLKKLRQMAVGGDLKTSKFRSVIWNVLLGSLNHEPEEWIQQRQDQRAKYHEIREKNILNAEQLQEAEERDNPLSQSKDSKWNQHFRDTELRQLIKQDVVRTNPNVDYYHKQEVQETMINILFCYAREYPSICYRQGMHEILAPLIFVLHCDLQAMCHIQEETSISLDPILVTILNPNYIEEDSYFLFCHIMNSLELFYRINDMTITESGQLTNIPATADFTTPTSSPAKSAISTSASPKRTSEIEVVHQLNLIRDKIFAKQDLHLHNHLLKLEIPLALFGIRWLRLLFGREFNLLDLLILWDAIFGIGDDLKFTYYVVVAMLIHIRDKLLSNDYTSCLTLLMRYPANADIGLIIRHALFMCEPDKYQCPPNAFVYVINSLRQRHSQPIRVYPPLATIGVKTPTSSSPRSLRDEIRRESAKISLRSQQGEDGVVDGMTLDDPEVLKMELQDSYNIMSVTRIKLVQYLSVLRKHIPGNQIDELHQTLDGLEELCSLLKPKHQYLCDPVTSAPIDAAFEADDAEEADSEQISRSFPMSVQKLNPTAATYEVPSNRISRNASQVLQNNRREVEMNLIRSSAIGFVDLSEYPSENPVADENDSD